MSWLTDSKFCDTLIVHKNAVDSPNDLFVLVQSYGDNLFEISTVVLNGLSVGKGNKTLFLSKEALLDEFMPNGDSIQHYQKRMRQTI